MSDLLNLILHAWLLSAVAVCFAHVLVSDGMLLAPVQAWVRAAWRKLCAWRLRKLFTPEEAIEIQAVFPDEIDSKWWWDPLWGCYKCVAGQWAFWGYLLSCVHLQPLRFTGYDPLRHLYFTSLTILFAAGWRAFYAVCQTK